MAASARRAAREDVQLLPIALADFDLPMFDGPVPPAAAPRQYESPAVVAYGADGGVRAVEHLRQILANFTMYVVRAQLSLSLFTEFGAEGFVPTERRAEELERIIDSLLKAARWPR